MAAISVPSSSSVLSYIDTGLFSLVLTSILNGRWVTAVLDTTRTTTDSFNGLDNLDRVGVCNLAKDDVLAVEPSGLNGGHEELRAVPVIERTVNIPAQTSRCAGLARDSRVRSSVCHTQQEGLVVPQLEVLIIELLAVDALSASAYKQVSYINRSLDVCTVDIPLPRVKSPPCNIN